jgi:hypothetical protein
MTHGAIQTEYKGYLFRSRLEARWAVFLDKIGMEWKYETEGYEVDGHRYLPDFWLPEIGAWAEAKGDPQGLRKEWLRMKTILGQQSPLPGFAEGVTSLVILGDVPDPGYGRVALHPALSRRSGVLERTWGFFVPSKGGGSQFVSDAKQSFLYMLFGKYAWTDASTSADSKAWDLDTWILDTTGSFTPINEAYRAARQSRFEHGANGR